MRLGSKKKPPDTCPEAISMAAHGSAISTPLIISCFYMNPSPCFAAWGARAMYFARPCYDPKEAR